MLTGFFYISLLKNRLPKIAYFVSAMRQCNDNRLFIEFPENYMLRTSCVQKVFFVLTFQIIFVHKLYLGGNSMNNLSSYCGLTDSSFWLRFTCIKAGKNCHQLWFFITMIFTALFLKLKIIPIFVVGRPISYQCSK